MKVATTIAEVRAAVARARGAGRRIGLVPTMGALHEGHLALVRLAAVHADEVVVSVFVNPTQFDRPDDLAAYPRDLDADLAALAALGERRPATIFAPPASELYPQGTPATTVSVAGLTDHLCGASRPGHFDGVALVVTKLLHAVAPDVAVFGRKDGQQLGVIRRLVADLDLDVSIVAGPTVREPDGLALSSRNARLTPAARTAAAAIPRALAAGVRAAREHPDLDRAARAESLREHATGTLEEVPELEIDYVEVVDPDTLAPPDGTDRGEAPAGGVDDGSGSGHLLLAVAVWFPAEGAETVRLIDNVEVGDAEDEDRLLAALERG